MSEMVEVERRNGIAIYVKKQIGNIHIKLGRRNGQVVEISRGKEARVYDRNQLEIPSELYSDAIRQAYAILFPKPKQSRISSSQLSLL